MGTCRGVTKKGERCQSQAGENKYCHHHLTQHAGKGSTAGGQHQRSPASGQGKAKATAAQRSRAKEEEHQRQQTALRRGPLRPGAQKCFDNGPREGKGPKGKDREGPGYVYVIHEPHSKVEEYKIGESEDADRRMRQLGSRNSSAYATKHTLEVNHRKFVERVLQLDLDAVNVKPSKKKADGSRQDGGTEWFKADFRTIKARANLVKRMYDADPRFA